MKIREVKEVEKEISFEKACVYLIADDNTMIGQVKQIADTRAADDSYVQKSVAVSMTGNKCTARFREETDREMTPAEEIAYHYLKINKLCSTITPLCKKCIFVDHCILDPERTQGCLLVMEGKEVINDD